METSHADWTLRIGALASLSFGILILVLLGLILTLRSIRGWEDRRRQRVTMVWRPLLAQCLLEVPPVIPALGRRDHVIFLLMWNHCFESIRGEAVTHLLDLARRLGSDRLAIELLHARALRRRLLAIVTLGHLQERSVWHELVALLQHENAFLSFVAAQALLQIDGRAAIPLLLPVISLRKDWSPLKVIAMLKAVDHDLAAETVAQAAVLAAPEIGARLIRHLAATRSMRGLPRLRRFLREDTPSDEVLSACLFLFGECSDPMDLPVIRMHLSHPTWYVRLQAAVALGKTGTEEDEVRLIALLNDAQWWVRYRAGEALVSLPSMTREKLHQLQVSLDTLDAQEILAPLLAKPSMRAA